jgi:hypothetical protein
LSMADIAALREGHARGCARERWGEAAAVAVLLGCDWLTISPRFCRHVTRSGVDWDTLLADTPWSPADLFLTATAAARRRTA